MSWSLLQFHAVIYPDGDKTLAVPGQLVVYFNGLGKPMSYIPENGPVFYKVLKYGVQVGVFVL